MSKEKFQIAISYAHRKSEKHEHMFITQVVDALKELEVKVFFAPEQQEHFFGKQLGKGFHDVFAQADCIVVFVSKGYVQEGSPILEMEKQIAFSPLSIATESVAVVAFDEQYVPPIYKSSLGYLLASKYLKKPRKLALVIEKRYKDRKKDKPTTNKSFFGQGFFNYLHGYYQQAANDFGEAVSINELDPFAHFNLGVMHALLDRYDKAIEHFNEAIQLNSDFVEAYYNLGVVSDRLSQHEKAIKNYDEAIKRRPDFVKAYHNRGVAKENLGWIDEAIKDYDKAICPRPGPFGFCNNFSKLLHKACQRSRPELFASYNNRGIAKSNLGLWEKAIKDYDESIRLKPERAGTYNNRGVAKASNKQFNEAIEDYDEAVQINPDYAEAYYNRGNAKCQLSQWQEAIKDYNKAIRLNSCIADAYHRRDLAKKELGLFDEVDEGMKKAQDQANKRKNGGSVNN